MRMADSITINKVELPKEQIDQKDVLIIEIPKLSVGHSDSIRIKLFTACGLVSIYYRNKFFCISTKEAGKTAASVLSARIKDIGEISEEKKLFGELDDETKERLLAELFRHAAAKGKYFGIYERTFFLAGENIDPFFTPAFELSVREFEDSYGYFINPTHLSMAKLHKAFEQANRR